MLKPLTRFMLRVIGLLPFTFMLWYWSAGWHLAPVTLISQIIVQWLVPDALLWLKLDGHLLLVATNFAREANGAVISPVLNAEVLGFQLNPLTYSYGLPLLAALMLATPSQQPFKRCLQGLLLLMPLEVFSIVVSVLKILSFEVGAAFQIQQALHPWTLEVIAVGYQLGVLLLPMIAPLILWVILQKEFLLLLAPHLKQATIH